MCIDDANAKAINVIKVSKLFFIFNQTKFVVIVNIAYHLILRMNNERIK